MKGKVLLIAVTAIALVAIFVHRMEAGRTALAIAPSAVRTASAGEPRQPIEAQQYYPVMVVTTAEPLQLPGRVLPPGQYSFRLLKSDSAVEVTTADGSRLFGLYPVGPAWRSTAGDGVLYTDETSHGAPGRVLSWFFRDQQDGYTFLYARTAG